MVSVVIKRGGRGIEVLVGNLSDVTMNFEYIHIILEFCVIVS